jgi:16S rRNA (cytosine1402-N4)-methyltransferase
MGSVVRQAGFEDVDGVLMDFGVSSEQLDTAERGFSFRASGPLDMRMDQREALTAAEIVNTWPESSLADIFFRLGEESGARRAAHAIVVRRRSGLLRIRWIWRGCWRRRWDGGTVRRRVGGIPPRVVFRRCGWL